MSRFITLFFCLNANQSSSVVRCIFPSRTIHRYAVYDISFPSATRQHNCRVFDTKPAWQIQCYVDYGGSDRLQSQRLGCCRVKAPSNNAVGFPTCNMRNHRSRPVHAQQNRRVPETVSTKLLQCLCRPLASLPAGSPTSVSERCRQLFATRRRPYSSLLTWIYRSSSLLQCPCISPC
jgi:hypothetical protein